MRASTPAYRFSQYNGLERASVVASTQQTLSSRFEGLSNGLESLCCGIPSANVIIKNGLERASVVESTQQTLSSRFEGILTNFCRAMSVDNRVILNAMFPNMGYCPKQDSDACKTQNNNLTDGTQSLKIRSDE